MKKVIALSLIMSIVACSSEAEKIRAKQVSVCEESITSGVQPTEFCLNLLPKYRAMYSNGANQSQQYQEQQPAYQQAAPVQDSSSVVDTMLGAVAGYTLGSSGNRGATSGRPADVNNHYYAAPEQSRAPAAAAPVIQPKQKTNYMDMSKMSAPIPQSTPKVQ